jgi:hypothetical protein
MSIPKHIIEHEEIGLDDDYLKLDQTTPQTVTGGAPKFDNGLIIKAGQKLIFDGD